MKKSSLMGASVVAAALLAAAPVVAPVASLATPATQVVKADAKSDRDNAIGRIKDLKSTRDLTTANNHELTTFKDGFVSLVPEIAGHTFSGTNTDNAPYVITATPEQGSTQHPFTVAANRNVAGLNYFTDGNVNTFDTQQIAEAAQRLNYKITFSYSNAIGQKEYTITSRGDAQKAYRDMTNNGGTITMTTTFVDDVDNTIDSFDSTVTYKVDNSAAAYVHYTTELNASVNDSADQYGLINSFANAGGSIIDKKGNDLLQTAVNNGAVSVGKLRYTNWNLPNFDADGNFTSEGTYYQHIVINLNKLNLQGGPMAAFSRGDITVNGETPSTNNVDANYYFAQVEGTVDGINYRDGSLILKRVVKVGPANLVTKDEKVNGVVTVNTSDITTAPLYDESGKVIADRSLPNKSRWQTDIKRTVYANGQVFYRVSTHEYIKADQVKFTANDASNSSDSTIKGDVVVTPSEGVFTMDNLGALLWSKSDDNNSMTVIADRYLPGQSAWRADKKAVVNGNTFYRVSTNEWVKADKGTFVAK